jgi:hypothetical protein
MSIKECVSSLGFQNASWIESENGAIELVFEAEE